VDEKPLETMVGAWSEQEGEKGTIKHGICKQIWAKDRERERERECTLVRDFPKTQTAERPHLLGLGHRSKLKRKMKTRGKS